MNPDFNETQLLLQSTVRRYLESEVPFDRVREHEAKQRADEKLWEAMAQQGWLGIPLPEEVGGGGAGMIEAGIFVHELARRAALVPAVEVSASALTLARAASGSEAEILSAITRGEAVVVPALLEANDSYTELRASVDAAGTLSGDKYYVDYAETATHHLVAAHGPQGLGLYLVERSEPGVSCESLSTSGRTPQSVVHYSKASARRVGDAGSVAFLARTARALTSAQIIGYMEVALEMTVAYTNLRVQFGQPLAAFQAVQHHAANMAMHTESSRFLVYEMLDALERGEASDEDIAIAKASVSRAIPEVTMLAHQLHGGQGLIEENDLYFFSIRGKDRALAWGSSEECLDEIAEHVEEPPRWL